MTMEAVTQSTFLAAVVSNLLTLIGLGITGAAVYLAYWWSMNHGFISLNDDGRICLKRKNLPPGSMGLPSVGETLLWRKNADEFYDSSSKRYGDIFKSHLFGYPTAVLTSPEAAKCLIVARGSALRGSAPGRVPQVVGEHFFLFEEADMHSRLRKLFMKQLLPESLKAQVPRIEQLLLKVLDSWGRESSIVFLDEVERFTLAVGMLVLLGPTSPISVAKIAQEFKEWEKGFVAQPGNRPGHEFLDSLKARKRITEVVAQLMETRRSVGNMANGDQSRTNILDSLISDGAPNTSLEPLPHEIIEDNAIGFLFASDRTTAGLISFMVKYLHDNPDVLVAIKVEQEKIQSRKGVGEGLCWEDFKDMPYTYQTLQESLRLSNVIQMQFREVLEEVEYKGYVIPKGWRIMSVMRQWHKNPTVFPNPQKFDPSRFETPKQDSYAPFGIGSHMCAGHELVRVEVLIFLHHLTTKFRWEVLESGPDSVYLFSGPHAGLPLKVTSL